MSLTAKPELARLLDLADAADTLLIDQFGTLHDGVAPYPGVVDALRTLRRRGARVALLSNSGKRVASNTRRLGSLGITPDCYDLSMTSGELGFRVLRDRAIPEAQGVARALLLSRGGDPLLEGTGIEPVSDPARAQLVVLAGSDGDVRPMADYEAALAPAARIGLPLVCLNPDRTMLTPSGFAFGAGQIAELYKRLGGTVAWLGKPHRAVYDLLFAELGDTDRARVAGVGDSIEHDIAGAHEVGCMGWLVRTGIIAGAEDDALEQEIARVGARPDRVFQALA